MGKLSVNDETTLGKIGQDLSKKMSEYTNSLQPTDDEVTIAWLLSVIDMLKETDTNRLNFLLSFLSIEDIEDIGDDTSTPGICVDYEAMEERLSWGRPDGNQPRYPQESHILTWNDNLRDIIDRAIESYGILND